MEFRKDINGLRAVAVLAVMFYHFGLTGFSGGFAGVDVFFVISGFLMTGIILTGISGRRFSVLSFYRARARRIVPALATLCGALLLGGWFFSPPADYTQLGKQAASALVFISNFTFRAEDGYFDSFSQDKWLLHTWSLSVEWQFYLLFPVFLMLLCRKCGGVLPLRRLAVFFTILAGASLTASVFLTARDFASAFYLLPTRMWEMTAGAFAFLLSLRARRLPFTMPMYATGLFLIGLSVTLFSAETPWPGFAALAPVLGAFFIIAAGFDDRFFLSGRVLQAVGTWSYSIYLWHWPVHVALRHAHLDQDPRWISFGLALSVLLGFLSYRFVETPLRRHSGSGTFRKAVLAAAFAALVLSGALVYWQHGVSARVGKTIMRIESVINDAKTQRTAPCAKGDITYSYPACTDESPVFAVWGDSHAGAAFIGMREAAGNRYGIAFNKGCPPLENGYLEGKKGETECTEYTRKVLERITTLPPDVPLIIMFRLTYYLYGYNEHPGKPVVLRYLDLPNEETGRNPLGIFTERLTGSLCTVAKGGRRVYAVKPTPEMGIEVPQTLSRQMMLRGYADDVTISRREYAARHDKMIGALEQAAQTCGVTLLDPVPYLCDETVCKGSENGLPLYHDDDHLSVDGARKLVPMFRPVFESRK